jgi:dipeptide/tripeptide permease
MRNPFLYTKRPVPILVRADVADADSTAPFLGLGGHPLGLSTLFFTEMWERFSFYGMRAILVLYLISPERVGGLEFDHRLASQIYGYGVSLSFPCTRVPTRNVITAVFWLL